MNCSLGFSGHHAASFSRRQFIALLLAAGTLPLASSRAFAAGSRVEAYAENLGRQVIKLARSNLSDAMLKRKFLQLLTRNANIRAVARFALGKYRRRMPKRLWNEYYKLVLDYIAGMFVQYRRDLAGKNIKAIKAIRRGKWTTVESELVFDDGGKSRVDWRIYTGGGPYRVGDVKIKGIWLSLRMRDKFVSILNQSKGDFGALMDYLRKNAA